MREFSISPDINASPERVWNVLADVQRWPEWTASISKIELLDEGPLGVGSRVRVFQPKLRPAVMTITEWEPGRGFVWVTRNPGLVAVGEHWINPSSSGCNVTLKLTFQGLLGGVVGILAGKLTRRYVELEAEGLKARSEGRR